MAKIENKKQKRRMAANQPPTETRLPENTDAGRSYLGKIWLIGRRSRLTVGIIAVVALGALGAGLKHLEEDAMRQMMNGQFKSENFQEKSFINTINPFLAVPPPAPTPQLSKELIYSGGKLVAIEDANAAAAPPADLAVWRPDTTNGTGTYYVMGSAGSQQTFIQWGAHTDIPAPGDFDGDGKTDFSVFRPANGNWYIQRSSDNSLSVYGFGMNGDLPAHADYDGDGQTDAAVYRPADGFWYIRNSSNGNWTAQQWGVGATAYKITPGDFDGDGKADFAVRYDNPADPNHTRQFVIKRSSDGQVQSIAFGAAGDTPVVGDYDGDGKDDAAVWRYGSWNVSYSSTGEVKTYTFGDPATDKAVQNDYDGDGKVDVAIWRPSNGKWYILQSSKVGQPDYQREVQWGQNGDIPVPAFYRR